MSAPDHAPWPGYSYPLPVGRMTNPRRDGKRERRCLAVLPGEGRCNGRGPDCGGPHRAGDSSDGVTHFLTPNMLEAPHV